MKKEYHIQEEFLRDIGTKEIFSRFYIIVYRPLYLFPRLELVPLTKPEKHYIYHSTYHGGERMSFDTLAKARVWCTNMCQEVPEPRVVEIIKCESK